MYISLDPNEFLQIVYGMLKKRGRILFILHDTNGLSVKVLGEKSPIFDIEHIYLFNRDNLANLFQKNGFKVVSTFSVKNTYPLFYWTRMFPLPPMIKKTLLTMFKITNLEDTPIALNAGNIGIIAEKKV